MAVRRLTAEGPAPVGLAWQRYAEIARWPEWSPQILRVEADAERIARGVTGTVHAFGGLRLGFTITDVDVVARRWSWLVRTPSGGLHAYFRPIDPEMRSWSLPGQHLDFRGDGGYVIAPPSRISNSDATSRALASS